MSLELTPQALGNKKPKELKGLEPIYKAKRKGYATYEFYVLGDDLLFSIAARKIYVSARKISTGKYTLEHFKRKKDYVVIPGALKSNALAVIDCYIDRRSLFWKDSVHMLFQILDLPLGYNKGMILKDLT